MRSSRAEGRGKLSRKLANQGAPATPRRSEPILGELATQSSPASRPLPITSGIYWLGGPGDLPVRRSGAPSVLSQGPAPQRVFNQAVRQTVENGHRTFIELAPNPVVLISRRLVTFSASCTTAELVETLRRKED